MHGDTIIKCRHAKIILSFLASKEEEAAFYT